MSNSTDLDVPDIQTSNFGSLKAAAIFVAVMAAVLALYWYPQLSGSASFFVSDHTYYFEPFSRFIGEAYRQGRIPLWNPYLYCGMSQLAVPSPGIFYPGSILFAIGTYSQAVAWQMLLHQLLAGLGMFLLVSSFGWGRAPSAVAALLAALSGYIFALTTNCTLAFSACILPILLWSFRCIAHSTHSGKHIQRWWFMLAASIATFMFVAAGRPEVFAPGVALLGVYCVIEAFTNRRSGIEASLVFAGLRFQLLAFLTGLAMTMPILLPVAEWAAVSPRAKGLTVSHALMWSTNWYDFVSLIYPQPFGDLLILGSKYLKLVATRASFYPYITSLFIGPVCFSLALWGFFDKKWLWRKWLLLGLLAFVIICLGEFTPVAPLLVRTFPSFSVLRYPIKLMIFPIVLLTIAAARGTKSLLAGEVSGAARFTAIGFWSLSIAAGIILFCVGQSNITVPIQAGLPAFASSALGRSMIGSSLIGLLCSGIEFSFFKGKLKRQLLALIVVLGLAANLLAVAFCNRQMVTSGDFFQHKQLVSVWLSELEKTTGVKGRSLNLYFDPLSTPSDYQFEPRAVWTANFFGYARELLLCNSALDCDRSLTFGYEAAETNVYRELVLNAVRNSAVDKVAKNAGAATPSSSSIKDQSLLDVPLLHLCQSTGTKWLTSQVSKLGTDLRLLDPDYFKLMREDRPMNVRLYKLKGAAPRCYFAENWKWVDSLPDSLKAAMTPPAVLQYAPLSMPLIERGSAAFIPPSYNALAQEVAKPPKASPPSPYPNTDQIKTDRLDRAKHPLEESEARVALQAPDSLAHIMVDKPEHVSLSVANKKAGFLVLCDHFYPGWCAFVDSEQVPLYKVNTEMRAVYLTPGTHLVEFDFRSDSLKNGLLIAGGGLFLVFCYGLLGAWPYMWKFVKSTAGQ